MAEKHVTLATRERAKAKGARKGPQKPEESTKKPKKKPAKRRTARYAASSPSRTTQPVRLSLPARLACLVMLDKDKLNKVSRLMAYTAICRIILHISTRRNSDWPTAKRNARDFLVYFRLWEYEHSNHPRAQANPAIATLAGHWCSNTPTFIKACLVDLRSFGAPGRKLARKLITFMKSS